MNDPKKLDVNPDSIQVRTFQELEKIFRDHTEISIFLHV